MRRLTTSTEVSEPGSGFITASGTCWRDWDSPAGKRQFVRAVLARRPDGSAQVTPVGGQGSHLVADLAHANCLAVVGEDVTQVRAGDVLRCMLLDRSRR